MTAQEDMAIKPQMKGERRQLFFRQQDDLENTERVISRMNGVRRTMGITEIQ
jgi:hypothetical protein